MFPGGFTVNTKPSLATVTTLISEADAIAQLRVGNAIGGAPAADAKGAVHAKRFIKAWVKAEVVRIAYAGNDPRGVDEAAAPYERSAEFILGEIDTLGEQGEDVAGTAFSRTRGTDGAQVRDLLISDETLGRGARGGNVARPW